MLASINGFIRRSVGGGACGSSITQLPERLVDPLIRPVLAATSIGGVRRSWTVARNRGWFGGVEASDGGF